MLCPFSYPSICGVWNRVYHIGKRLAERGHEVHVFSSNIIKGTNQTSSDYKYYKGIHIHRSPVILALSENALFWRFKNKIIQLKPDVIDAHVYRHPHSSFASLIAHELRVPCFITTHAPFLEKGLRKAALELAVNAYDLFIGKIILNSYTGIIVISKWEKKFLHALGCLKNKIVYAPNGVSELFFKENMNPEQTNKILFVGRVAPVKSLETLVYAAQEVIKNHRVRFIIIGPEEQPYADMIKQKVKDLKLEKCFEFRGPIYEEQKMITAIKNSDIFVLPSKREGIPQSLIEAMALGRIVISSKTMGGKELVTHGKNGFLFPIEDSKKLALLLNHCIERYKRLGKMKKNARRSAKSFNWEKIVDTLERLFKKNIKK